MFQGYVGKFLEFFVGLLETVISIFYISLQRPQQHVVLARSAPPINDKYSIPNDPGW